MYGVLFLSDQIVGTSFIKKNLNNYVFFHILERFDLPFPNPSKPEVYNYLVCKQDSCADQYTTAVGKILMISLLKG